jgi:hypothetical protein
VAVRFDMRSSTNAFILSGAIFVASLIVYVYAQRIWNEDLERLQKSPFWGSTLDIGPYLNWAHYVSFGIFVAAIGATAAAVLLRRSEKGLQK